MTFKTLLVDDEILTIQALEKLIPQLDPRFSIVGTAQNGKIAYDQVCSLHPDLIFLDVNMPVRSGLQLLEQLRAENKDCIIIILSAYREFEYAQSAMKNGASLYLLKPLEPQKLKAALAEVSERLIAKRQNSALDRTLLPGRLAKIFSDSANFAKSYQVFSQQYGLPSQHIMLAGAFGLLHDAPEAFPAYAQRLNDGLSPHHIFCFTLHGYFFFLLSYTQESLRFLRSYLSEISDSCFLLCISKHILSISKIFSEFKLICDHLSTLFYYSDSTRVFPRADHVVPPTGVSDPTILGALHLALQEKQPDRFLQHLEQYMLTCAAQKSCSPESVYKTVFEVLVLFKTSDQLHDETLKLELNALTYHALHRYWNIDQLFLFVYNLSLRFFEQNASANDSNTIALAKAFCSKHYPNNIGLQEVADHVHMSKSYFSTYFKAQTGITFSAYLTNIRMNVAKHMLASTNMRINEIAAATGYTNTSHFIRIFKEHVHMTPQEYRNGNH